MKKLYVNALFILWNTARKEIKEKYKKSFHFLGVCFFKNSSLRNMNVKILEANINFLHSINIIFLCLGLYLIHEKVFA